MDPSPALADLKSRKESDQGIEDASMIDAHCYQVRCMRFPCPLSLPPTESDLSFTLPRSVQPEPHAASLSHSKGAESFHGCAYLQAVQEQLGAYGTSTGDYLEAVFTHRELFVVYPQGHRACAIGYTNLATMLENREWRPDRDGDMEAAGVFRHEAMMLASSC